MKNTNRFILVFVSLFLVVDAFGRGRSPRPWRNRPHHYETSLEPIVFLISEQHKDGLPVIPVPTDVKSIRQISDTMLTVSYEAGYALINIDSAKKITSLEIRLSEYFRKAKDFYSPNEYHPEVILFSSKRDQDGTLKVDKKRVSVDLIAWQRLIDQIPYFRFEVK